MGDDWAISGRAKTRIQHRKPGGTEVVRENLDDDGDLCPARLFGLSIPGVRHHGSPARARSSVVASGEQLIKSPSSLSGRRELRDRPRGRPDLLKRYG